MRALNFVIGLIVGMILLVVAVVGAIIAAGTLVSVGQIESTLGTDILEDESSVNDKTILELVQSVIDDLQDMDGLTINKLKTDYGLKIPTEISGIDISPVFDYPITEVPDHLGDIVNNMTLRDVGEFLDMDFETEYPDLGILQENLDTHVDEALDNLLSAIDDETLSIYTIGRDFGLSLGSNEIVDSLSHTPLSSFANVMDYLSVGMIMDADRDLFVEDGDVPVYVGEERYVALSSYEVLSSAEGDIAETYIAGADENGLIYREMRYIQLEDGSFVADNSCYSSSFDPEEDLRTFYRRILYSPYEGTNPPADAEFFVPVLLNRFLEDEDGGFSLMDGGMLSLNEIYYDEDGGTTLNEAILNDPELIRSGAIDLSSLSLYLADEQENGSVIFLPATSYGIADGVADEDTRLSEEYDGWTRVHIGSADAAMQVIANETISSVPEAMDRITSLRLGEVLEITDESAKIMITLQDTPINEMDTAIDTITLGDALDVDKDGFDPVSEAELENGDTFYVFNELGYPVAKEYGTDPVEDEMFRRTSVGESNVIMKQLAWVQIQNLSAATDEIIETTLLADLIDVVEYTSVRNATLGDANTDWFFDHDANYTVGSGADAKYYTFVYDGKGQYYLSDVLYLEVASAQLQESGETVFWKYESNSAFSSVDEVDEFLLARDGGKNIYFFMDGAYKQNPALVAYCRAQIALKDDLSARAKALSVLQDSFSRVSAAADEEGAVSAPAYKNVSSAAAAGGLYVMSADYSSFGDYELYDPEDLTHHDVPLFFKYTDGYYPASSETEADGSTEKFSFDYDRGEFVSRSGEGATYVRLNERKDGERTGLYYFVQVDSDFMDGYTVFSKRECDYVFIRSNNGEWVNDGGEYILYDRTNPAHAKLDRYTREIGYIGNDAANDGGTTGLPQLSDRKIVVLEEKSPTILLSLLQKRITIGNMNDAIADLTVEELMEIEPGTLFDNEKLRTAAIDDVSVVATEIFKEMTVGELLTYSNVAVDREITYILQSVRIPDFFSSLVFNRDTATIEVDMYELFGV